MSLFGSQKSTSLDSLLNRTRPSAWQQFLNQPCVFLAHKLYSWKPKTPAQPLTNPVSVVCVSDTHNAQPKLPDGDILIHAGDLTQSGSLQELQATVNWLRLQPHPTKIIIAGNHDLLLDANFPQRRMSASGGAIDWGDIIYLQDSETTVTCNNGRQLHIYGSPYSPRHGNWAFQYPRSENFWDGKIPDNIDILITHGPPPAHLDLLRVGCIYLLKELWQVRPRLHVFGHVHEGSGMEWLYFDSLQHAYERTVASGGGVLNLAWTLKEFVQTIFHPATEAKCLLVNPAIVGGLRDDERRRPIRVII